MSGELLHGLQANLLSPPVLFLALGLLAAVVRSDLKFPKARYTLFEVEVAVAKGERTADIAEFGNIQVEVIVPAAACERLMERLEREFFPKYTMIAYEADVRVRRPDKF